MICLKFNVIIITNNPEIMEKYCNDADIIFVEGQYMDVLLRVRDKIHTGCKLLTHPLMGSIKPNETPYRSLILEKAECLDFQSLQIIESSIETCRKFLNNRPAPLWNEKILEDFRFVDKKLFESAFESLL